MSKLGLGLGLVVSCALGCGVHTYVVVAPAGERPVPVVESATQPCRSAEGHESVDDYISQGDGYRDQLLAALPARQASGVLPEGSVDAALAEQWSESQREVNQRYALYRQAKSCYSEALRLDASNAYAFLSMATVALRIADVVAPQAREEYLNIAQTNLQHALELNRFDPQAIYYQAELQIRRGNPDEARRKLDQLQAGKWDQPQVHNLLGYLLETRGDRAGALREYTAASQLEGASRAVDWAIQRKRQESRRRWTPTGDDKSEGYMRWNPRTKKPEPMPSLPEEWCGWSAKGQSLCAE
jgi:tetratricopeptide (TPR) repeat protein